MSNQKGFIGFGILIAIVLGLLVVGGGAYYVTHQSAVSQIPQNYPVTPATQQTKISEKTSTPPSKQGPTTQTIQYCGGDLINSKCPLNYECQRNPNGHSSVDMGICVPKGTNDTVSIDEIVPASAKIGDLITITGSGFSTQIPNTINFDGKADVYNAKSSDGKTISFVLPQTVLAGCVSGSTVCPTPGASYDTNSVNLTVGQHRLEVINGNSEAASNPVTITIVP